MKLPAATRSAIDHTIATLADRLGENLYSCVLYGSAIRGDFVPVKSDANLLIVLRESTPEAHAAIAEALGGQLPIDPFVIGLVGMDRSFKAFALKFLDIKQDYELLYGSNPLAEFKVDESMERFLCEQALRNVRLRLVRGFIVFGNDTRRYRKFLLSWISTIFMSLSGALRLAGTEVPRDFGERVLVLERGFGVDTSVLRDLLEVRNEHRLFWIGHRLSSEDVRDLHSRLFRP